MQSQLAYQIELLKGPCLVHSKVPGFSPQGSVPMPKAICCVFNYHKVKYTQQWLHGYITSANKIITRETLPPATRRLATRRHRELVDRAGVE